MQTHLRQTYLIYILNDVPCFQRLAMKYMDGLAFLVKAVLSISLKETLAKLHAPGVLCF